MGTRRLRRRHSGQTPTAADVALLAGVSTSTVSLVANGRADGRVSDLTQERVRAAMLQVGYVVNPTARGLATGRHQAIALLSPDMSNPFLSLVAAGVASELGNDYRLVLAMLQPAQVVEAEMIEQTLSLGIDGALIFAPSRSVNARHDFARPYVLMEGQGGESYAPTVNYEISAGAKALARHLAELGHVRLAYIDGITPSSTFELRREVFWKEFRRRTRGATMDVVASTIDIDAARSVFASAWPGWRSNGVTAVVCATDPLAYGVLAETQTRRIRVPSKLSLASFDDLPFSSIVTPALTEVRLPAAELGTRAARLLRDVLEGRRVKTRSVQIPAVLIARGSTGPALA